MSFASFRFTRPAVMAAVVAAVLALLPGSLRAQDVSGKWLIEYVGRMRIENGIQSGEKVQARLELAQQGDSVTGTWTVLDGSQPSKVAGTFKGNKLVLVSEPSEARANRNGEEQVVRITRALDLTVTGTTLSGEMTLEGGLRAMPPRGVTGKKEG